MIRHYVKVKQVFLINHTKINILEWIIVFLQFFYPIKTDLSTFEHQ